MYFSHIGFLAIMLFSLASKQRKINTNFLKQTDFMFQMLW